MPVITPKLERLFNRVSKANSALALAESELRRELFSAIAKVTIPQGLKKAEIARRMKIKRQHLQDLLGGRRNWSYGMATAFERAVEGVTQ